MANNLKTLMDVFRMHTNSIKEYISENTSKVSVNQSTNKLEIDGTETDIGNFKAVSTEAGQNLSSEEQAAARANIGAGTSSVSIGDGENDAAAGNHTHDYSEMQNPPLGSAAEFDTMKVLNQPDTWESKSWSGLTSFDGSNVWTDGTDIYYSSGSSYVLDKSTSTWSTKTWTGLTQSLGNCIWTDGKEIYYSYQSNQYVLNKSTSTWSTKTWTGLTSFYGEYIWSNGDTIFYSQGSIQTAFDKSASTWYSKKWTGLTSFYGNCIWTDGKEIYYSSGSTQYVLDKDSSYHGALSTWKPKTWSGLTNFDGDKVWTDGTDIYYSNSTSSSEVEYILDKATSTWIQRVRWSGLTSIRFRGDNVWTDGENLFYSSSENQYVLKKPLKSTKIPNVMSNMELTAAVEDLRTDPFYTVPINHNMIYRGKNLGASLTDAQHTALSSGNFTDLYLGDYWTKSVTIPAFYEVTTSQPSNWSTNYTSYYTKSGDTYTAVSGASAPTWAANTYYERQVPEQTVTLKAVIADFDTFYAGYASDYAGINTHHAAVIVHGFNNVVWNKTNTTAGGYVNSLIHKWLVNSALPQIETWFGSAKVLSHQKLLTSAITGDAASGWKWSSQKISLLSENQLYGSKVWGGSKTANGGYEPGEAFKHLNVFNHIDANLLFGNKNIWCRDIASAGWAAILSFYGRASYHDASAAWIAPAALILLS